MIRTKVFEDYIRDHVVSWFNWAQKNKLDIEMEDLILVSSRTLVSSWAAATLVDANMEAEISLASIPLQSGGANFVWSKFQGPVEYRNSLEQVRSPGYVYLACIDFFSLLYGKQPSPQDQCVFIKGFRAKRVFFFRRRIQAAAEPQPDDPDNRSDDEIQVTRAPGYSRVSSLPFVGRWRKNNNDLFPVSRPAQRGFGLYCRGSSTWVLLFPFDILSGPQRSVVSMAP